jgi:hypothetical protein
MFANKWYTVGILILMASIVRSAEEFNQDEYFDRESVPWESEAYTYVKYEEMR